MVEYSCEKCGKVFSQKGHFTNHQKRKKPCKPIENKIIEEKVQEKIKELSENGEIEIKNINLISTNQNIQNKNMDIYNIINVRNSLRDMSDEDFEEFLPSFCDKLVIYGFDNFIKTYNNGLQKTLKIGII